MGQRNDFRRQLELGQMGEELVSRFVQSMGYGVIPSYAFSGQGGQKAPRLMFERYGLVLPDLDLCGGGRRTWCEVKTYRGPAYNRAHKAWVHGICQRLRCQYTAVEHESGCPVGVAVLEVETGQLLYARLFDLPHWPCMCGGCQSGGRCRAPIKAGSYWPRDSMRTVYGFSGADMKAIRHAWRREAA